MTHCALPGSLAALELNGEAVQGGLMFGQAEPGSAVRLDGRDVMVSDTGRFVIGFGRDESGTRVLSVNEPGGVEETIELTVAARDYRIERVDGLLVGGAMAYTFLHALGRPTGASLVEPERVDDALRVLATRKFHKMGRRME